MPDLPTPDRPTPDRLTPFLLTPVSALASVAVPGRHGRPEGEAGLSIQERDGLQIASLAARRGQAGALAAIIRERFAIDLPTAPRFVASARAEFLWSGADQWMVVADAHPGDLVAELRQMVAATASVTAQGDGRALLRLHGPAVREVLAGVVGIDLHPRSFRAGDTALTLAGHVGVQLRQLDDAGGFELMVFRSYAASLFHTVLEAGLRFGVTVLPVDVAAVPLRAS